MIYVLPFSIRSPALLQNPFSRIQSFEARQAILAILQPIGVYNQIGHRGTRPQGSKNKKK